MRVRPTQPPITITTADYERLFNLLESPQLVPAVGDYLLGELERARVIAPEDVAPTVATMESRLVFRNESTGDIRTAMLVYPGAEDIAEGRISVVTPVGAALLGLSEGQSIAFETRAGETRVLTLVQVLSQGGPAPVAQS